MTRSLQRDFASPTEKSPKNHHAHEGIPSSCSDSGDEEKRLERSSFFRGPPLKGKIVYGEQVNLISCLGAKLVMKGVTAADEAGPQECDVQIVEGINGWRSEDTKKCSGHIKWELEQFRRKNSESSLFGKSQRCWFSTYSDGAEFVLLPVDADFTLGDVVCCNEPLVLCQASSFGGIRRCLSVKEKTVVLVPMTDPRKEEVVQDAEVDHSAIWYFSDVDYTTPKWPVLHLQTVSLRSHSGHQLIVVADAGSYSATPILDISTTNSLRSAGSYWRIQPVRFPPSPLWANHFLADNCVTVPVEILAAELFESTVAVTPEAHELILGENGRIDLGIQELLLVEDLLHCLMGVSGEFIRLTVCYPLMEERSSSRKTVSGNFSLEPSELPRYEHSYSTMLQREFQENETQCLNRRVDDILPYDLPLEIDKSLRAMCDKIMQIVHQVALIRHVAEHHLTAPSTTTNEALGTAMKAVLRELDIRCAELEAVNSQGVTLSLQKLWSTLHGAKPSLNLLAVIASKTYGIQGLPLLDILCRIRSEVASNTTQKLMASFVIRFAAEPLDSMLTKWIFGGVLDDPRGEFFVVSDPRLRYPATELQKWLFWTHKYRLVRELVPTDLQPFGKSIVECGRAWQIIKMVYGPEDRQIINDLEKECSSEVLNFEKTNLTSIILRTHGTVMRKLYQIILNEGNLLHRLRSIQDFMFMAKSDLFVNFCDLAEPELSLLNSNMDAILQYWTQALNYSVLRNSPHRAQFEVVFSNVGLSNLAKWADVVWKESSEKDPKDGRRVSQGSAADERMFMAPRIDDIPSFKTSIRDFVEAAGVPCNQDDTALIAFLDSLGMTINDECVDLPGVSDEDDLPESWKNRLPFSPREDGCLPAFESLTCLIKMPWPLHLIVNMETLLGYQTIYRILFQIGFVLRRLTVIWKNLSQLQRLQQSESCCSYFISNCLRSRHVICRFLSNLTTYFTEEVLQPKAYTFNEAAGREKSLREIQALHNRFVRSAIKEFLFTQGDIFRSIMGLVTDCNNFANFANKILIRRDLQDGPKSMDFDHYLDQSVTANTLSATNFDSIENLQMIRGKDKSFHSKLQALIEALVESR